MVKGGQGDGVLTGDEKQKTRLCEKREINVKMNIKTEKRNAHIGSKKRGLYDMAEKIITLEVILCTNSDC